MIQRHANDEETESQVPGRRGFPPGRLARTRIVIRSAALAREPALGLGPTALGLGPTALAGPSRPAPAALGGPSRAGARPRRRCDQPWARRFQAMTTTPSPASRISSQTHRTSRRAVRGTPR